MKVRHRVASLRSGKSLAALLIVVFGFSHAPSVLPSSILQVGLADMLQESNLIFHGQAIDTRVEAIASASDIHTFVTFEVIDVIKGQFALSTIELSFMGGTHNGLTLHIAETNVPVIGEEGIYFIEHIDRQQVNPIYGWQQGHFRVIAGEQSSEKFVFTHDMQGIFELNPEKSPTSASISKSYPLGVATKSRFRNQPMTLAEVKQRLRILVGE